MIAGGRHILTARETGVGRARHWIVECSCNWYWDTGARTEPKAITAAEQRHPAARQHPCPTPQKRRYANHTQADNAMRKFWATGSKGKPMPCRTYQCPCGGWHLTSKPHKDRHAS